MNTLIAQEDDLLSPVHAILTPRKLGVVEEGALADLLLVDGNPIENIVLVEKPAKNFLVIMKGGKFYRSTLTR